MPFQIPGTSITISRRRNQARHSPLPPNTYTLENPALGQPISASLFQLDDNEDIGRSAPGSPTPNTKDLETSSSSPSATLSAHHLEGSAPAQTLSFRELGCAACRKPMEGAFVRALGTVYHLSCFKCMDCGQLVASKFFSIEATEGKQLALCERDYFRRLNLTCAKCGGALRGSYISACSKKYHVEHFTCSFCCTVFGPQDSYYEHDGDVYCHYHYSTRCAGRCVGCNHAILKKFVEIKRNGREEIWHPECYMISKYWNVKVALKLINTSPADGEPQEQAYLEEESKETAASLKEKQDKTEQQVYRIRTVLSTFEESGAACLSDMLRQVSEGEYLNAIRLAEKLILHVEVLFAVIDDLEFRFTCLGLRGTSHVREARMLCRKTVELFTLLSRTQQTGAQQNNVTQDLLALVTGFAHYMKVLIRVALTGALKLEREHNVREAVELFLDKFHMLAVQGGNPIARRTITDYSGSTPSNTNQSTEGVTYGFRSLAPEIAGESPFTPAALRDSQLSFQKLPSDLCIKCNQTVEEDCVRLGTYQRWHSDCIQCSVCGKVALVPAPKDQPLASNSEQHLDKVLHQSEKPSTAQRPLANVGLFVYDPKSTTETPFGEVPTAIYCAEHSHPNCKSGFEPVKRLEQYAFLLNVALRRLYLLLKRQGIISLPPVDPASISSTESQPDQGSDYPQLLSPMQPATVPLPSLSAIIENPARKLTQIPESPPVLDKQSQWSQMNTIQPAPHQNISRENHGNVKDSLEHHVPHDESYQRVGESAPPENQPPAQPPPASTQLPPIVPNRPSAKSSAHRPVQPSITNKPPMSPPTSIRPLPQPPNTTPPTSLPPAKPLVRPASPVPTFPPASSSSIPTQISPLRNVGAYPPDPSANSISSKKASIFFPLKTDTVASEGKLSQKSTPASTVSTQGYPQANTDSRFFNRAHHFAISNPNMYDIGTQHNYYHGSTNALDCLAKYTMTGAEHDSSIREHSPRCHPGTREDIVQDILADLHDLDRKVKMIWMRGPAGVGKSAIMQTLAEAQTRETLGAALFISKVDKRNESRRVFPTIAYQLAVQSPLYQTYIGERIKADPKLLEKSLAEQFESLITIPFTRKHVFLDSDRFVILLDGLDECQSEREQCKIIDLIHNFVARHPVNPLTWIIASRPELHLQLAFSRAKDKLEIYRDHHICMHAEQASRDVEHYLRDDFARIQQSYPDSIPSASPWPSNRQLLKIANASSGFFLFASSVLAFIDSGDPVSRLHRTLALLDSFGPSTPSPNENPFQMLDILYAKIMSEIPTDVLSVTKSLLGYYLPRKDSFPTNKGSFLLACNFLGIERHIAYGALHKFYSVLAFPSSVNAHHEDLQFSHTSFADYLRNPTRSKIYSVDLDHAMTEQWRCYARILVEWLDGYSHECVKLCWVPDLENQHHAAYELRENMFNQASSSWTVMLYRYCHSWCPASCALRAHNSPRLTLSLSEVSNFLRQMDFGVPAPFGKDPVDMLDFLTWIRDHAPMELRKEVIAQEFPLKKLKRPRLFQAFCEKKWYRGVTERYRRFEVEINGKGIEQIGHLDSSEWETAEEILQGDEGKVGDLVRLASESHDMVEVMVTVMGADPSKCCGIIRHQKSPTEVQYHIFPYGEIYLQGSPRLTMVSLD